MKKLLIYHLFLFIGVRSFCQVATNNDTINSNIVVVFDKVKPSSKESRISTMYLIYLKTSKQIMVRFDVPSYIFRLNTSLNDYGVFKTANGTFTLLNKIEGYFKGQNQNIYSFVFITSRDSLMKILSPKLDKVTFYFTPNENKLKEFLEKKYFLNDRLNKYFIKLSTKTIKYTISKPEKIQYEKLFSWLTQL